MTIEELIARVGNAGWRINNLFQISDGTWRANLRKDSDEDFTAFSPGATAGAALEAAFTLAEKLDRAKAPRDIFFGDDAPVRDDFGLASLLTPEENERIRAEAREESLLGDLLA